MSLTDFIATLFFHIDEAMTDVTKDPRAQLWPSDLVTIGVLYVLKAQSQRRFWQWLAANYLYLFPTLPERTRLFRLMRVHRDWADRFLAEPGLLLVSDSLGIELIHPHRQGRSEGQVGEKGKSNGTWE